MPEKIFPFLYICGGQDQSPKKKKKKKKKNVQNKYQNQPFFHYFNYQSKKQTF